MDNFIIIFTTVVSGISMILFFIILKIILIDLPKYEKQINKLHNKKIELMRYATKDQNRNCFSSREGKQC